MVALGNGQTTIQILYFFSMYLCRCALSENAASTDIIQIIQILCRITSQFMQVQLLKRLNRLTFQTYIIIIGRVYYCKFCLSIPQSTFLTFVELITLFVNTLHAGDGTFTEVVKVLIMRTALTQTHLLHIAHQKFQLIVSHLWNLVQIVLSSLVIHPDHLDKSKIIQAFSGTFCL